MVTGVKLLERQKWKAQRRNGGNSKSSNDFFDREYYPIDKTTTIPVGLASNVNQTEPSSDK